MNCVANGKLIREKIFKNVWIQPAAGDAGFSGAALGFYYDNNLNNRQINSRWYAESFLGLSTQSEIEFELKNWAKFEILDEEKLISKTAFDLSQNKAVGWFQGRMEFGPRALGARSILANPKSPEMQKI